MEWIRGEVIGRGSFGTVNLAKLTKSNTNHQQQQQQNPSFVVKSSHVSNSSSLENEKKILTKLGNCHTNIIQYLGDSISEEKGTQFYNLFLEYASKGSLADYLRKSGGKFGNSDVKRYTKGILNGLSHVHENGFVHCDVKLQNVLVFEDGGVKLADFGLAKTVKDNDSGSELRGTPLYMSPEILAGGKVTAAADVWAVGCAVAEMVSGLPVWEYSPENDVSGLMYRIGVLGECPKIPESLCDEGRDFLSKCFLKDPKERWTASMLLDHPFISGCDGDNDGLIEKPSVSPKCPFEFPDWESVEQSSFGSGSVESFDFQESDISSWSSISSRFDEELVSERVPDWSELTGWITIR
ncbi:mitogen-activated protein kinase kinase kinase 20-like [Silene latifolia]|uniref:mitogen-activated protein kinase kinase kinase 20-like n=1 Tax=Silene latifolia TaxID=37657 RepID=UPI003D76ACCE